MGIEREIKQTGFKSTHQKGHINILYTANWHIDGTKKVLKPFDITHQQFYVLKNLKGRFPGSCAAFDIKEVMLDKGPDVTRLDNRALVTRRVCENNCGRLDIAISQRGLKLVKTIEPKIDKHFKNRRNITDKEAMELSRVLDKIRG